MRKSEERQRRNQFITTRSKPTTNFLLLVFFFHIFCFVQNRIKRKKKQKEHETEQGKKVKEQYGIEKMVSNFKFKLTTKQNKREFHFPTVFPPEMEQHEIETVKRCYYIVFFFFFIFDFALTLFYFAYRFDRHQLVSLIRTLLIVCDVRVCLFVLRARCVCSVFNLCDSNSIAALLFFASFQSQLN